MKRRRAQAFLDDLGGPSSSLAIAPRLLRPNFTESARVLVIHPDQPTRRLLRVVLEEAGHIVRETPAGLPGLDEAGFSLPDIVILDFDLPDISAIDAVSRLREAGAARLLVLSQRTSQDVKVAVLDGGADDFLANPFDAAELLARIRVLLRSRSAGDEQAVVNFGPIQVNLASRTVSNQGRDVQLSATEFAVLRLLIVNGGRTLSHRQILRDVWGQSRAKRVNYLRVYMHKLRQKLEDDPNKPTFLLTAAGMGYRLANRGPVAKAIS